MNACPSVIQIRNYSIFIFQISFVFRAALEFVNEAIGELQKIQSESNEIASDKFSFLAHLLSRPELLRSDVDIITLSLFGDGLSTVG